MNEEEMNLNLDDWYTNAQAHARLEANAGRKLDPSISRQVTRGKHSPIRSRSLGHIKLYYKPDVDRYHVEERGQKAGRAQRIRGLASRQARKQAQQKKRRGPGTARAMAV